MIRPVSTTPGAAHDADGAAGHVCPFCGLTREITSDFDPASPCPRCTLSDTPQTRNATKLRVGPWHVRQVRNPWAPGMRFETLLALVKRGQVTRDSIVRGPTTFQLWKRASEVRGLSREFGLCYSCRGEVDPQGKTCPHCNRMQDPPANPDALLEAREASPGAGAAGVATGARSASNSADEPASLEMASSTPTVPAGSDPADLLAIGDERNDETATARPGETPVNAVPAQQGPEKRPPAAPQPAAVKPSGTKGVEKPEVAAKLQRSTPPMQSSPTPPARHADKRGAAKPPVETAAREKPRDEKPRDEKPPTEKPSSAAPSSETPAAETSPPPKDRPLTIRPRTPGAEDALLTPQELAAAFQLDFSPQAGERRGSSKLAGVVLAVVLLAGGASALLYLRPDLRAGASEWWSGTWASARDFVSSRTVPATKEDAAKAQPAGSNRASAPAAAGKGPIAVAPPRAAAPSVSPEPASQRVAAAPVTVDDPWTASQTPSTESAQDATTQPPQSSPSSSPPVVMETPEPSETPAGDVVTGELSSSDVATEATAEATTGAVTPADPPAKEVAGSADAAPAPVEPVVRPVPATTPREAASPVAGQSSTPTPVPPAPAPVSAPAVTKTVPSSANAYEEARRLLGKALDAEENQDYVEAVRCYEAIKRLPVDARAMGIDVRLARARKLIQ